MAASSRHGEADPAAAFGLLAVIGIGLPIMLILLIIVSIGFAFAFPLIVDRRLSGVNAVKVSFKAGMANFWSVFGLLLLNGLVSLAGVCLCFVGLFCHAHNLRCAGRCVYAGVCWRPGHPLYTAAAAAIILK
jgi:hypothetical protein